MVHAQASLHSMPPAHVSAALHETSQRPVPHMIAPPHAWRFAHDTEQLVAPPHSTPPPHESMPLHWT